MATPAQQAGLLRAYDLGRLFGAAPLAGGGPGVLRISAERGSFVLKAAGRLADVELQARAARHLSDRGIRQPAILPTRTGAVMTTEGYFLQEFLPGAIVLRPDQRQTDAVMGHIGAYHRALADLPAGDDTAPDTDALWTRVADPGYLLGELPGLLARHHLAGEPELAALRALDQARAGLLALPRQIVHGDIGPDNVLMDGSAVVSIVDFTPFQESALFGAATALYWYHVLGAGSVSLGRLRQSMAALGESRPWTDAERELWPFALLREALRRLATPLALAEQSGEPPFPSVSPRHAALIAVLDTLH